MNDDLERRLHANLRQGSLPVAPDALRDRLSRLPMEPRGSRWSGVFSGLRLAAFASAAAVAIAFVLVARSLPGPTGTGPGSSLGASLGSAGTSPVTSASALATSQPSTVPAGPSAAPSPSPVIILPTSQPSLGPGFTCAPTSVLPATTSAVVQIASTRVGTHAGYDRIVIELAGSKRPRLTVDIAHPPFVGDASGQPVKVTGNTFLMLRLYDASRYPSDTGPDSFTPGYPNLVNLVNTGDYEGYVTWIAGLQDSPCYRITTLTNPTRIVVDVQAP